MNKRKVTVINNGRRVRERLGTRFLPNQKETLLVNSRQYLTLKAVRDLEVTLENEDTKEKDVQQDEDSTEAETNNEKTPENDEKDEVEEKNIEFNTKEIQELQKKINESTIEQVVNMVRNNHIDINDAIAYEMVGKNRTTLLDTLEEMKNEE